MLVWFQRAVPLRDARVSLRKYHFTSINTINTNLRGRMLIHIVSAQFHRIIYAVSLTIPYSNKYLQVLVACRESISLRLGPCMQCPAQLDGQIHSSNSNQIVKQIYYFDFNDAVHSVVWWCNGNKVRTTINANNWSYFSQRILLCIVWCTYGELIGILLIVESPPNERKYNTSLYWCIICDVSGQVETAHHHHHVFNVFIVFIAVSNFHIIVALHAAMTLAKMRRTYFRLNNRVQ